MNLCCKSRLGAWYNGRIMVKSMTGFGRGVASLGEYSVTVELTTVNRKQFDANVWLPREWHCFEVPLLTFLKTHIARGAVKCSVSVVAGGANRNPALGVLETLRAVAREAQISDTPTLSDLIALTTADVAQALPSPDDVAQEALFRAAEVAVAQLTAMRSHEGALIVKDLRERLGRLAEIQQEIESIAPTLPKLYQAALLQRIQELTAGAVILPEDVLAREVALFAERCDIAEEMTRLRAHFVHADTLLTGDSPCGRALDFLCQEFMREINTTGSKCNNHQIAQRVITFKTLLETVREQVQNLE